MKTFSIHHLVKSLSRVKYQECCSRNCNKINRKEILILGCSVGGRWLDGRPPALLVSEPLRTCHSSDSVYPWISCQRCANCWDYGIRLVITSFTIRSNLIKREQTPKISVCAGCGNFWYGLFVSMSGNLRLDGMKAWHSCCSIGFSPLASPYFIHWPWGQDIIRSLFVWAFPACMVSVMNHPATVWSLK